MFKNITFGEIKKVVFLKKFGQNWNFPSISADKKNLIFQKNKNLSSKKLKFAPLC
jgi:hypothetical protein